MENAAYHGARPMTANPWTITRTPKMYPKTRPKPPPARMEEPARSARAAIRRSQSPHAQV
jgi:hypothetical protein